MKNEEVRYLLKLFTLIEGMDFSEKQSPEFQKMYKKLVIIDKQITASEKYNKDMLELSEEMNSLEKEELKEVENTEENSVKEN